MSSSNSKNFTCMILLGCIVLFTFAYGLFSSNINDTIHTDVKEVEVEE